MWWTKARFRRRSTHEPNLTDELSMAKERRLNQFGTAVLVWCGKSVKFDRVCRTFVELNLGSTHDTPSESDVAPESLPSRTYSGKVRRLSQAKAKRIHQLKKNSSFRRTFSHSIWGPHQGHRNKRVKKVPYLRTENPRTSKTIPYSAARTYIVHIWEYPPPGLFFVIFFFFFH